MANKLYDEDAIRNIAGAIRDKNGTTTTYKVGEMAAAIEKMPVSRPVAHGPNVDTSGTWHKPEEWDDIESIVIPEGSSEVYILYQCHVNSSAFCSLRVFGSGMTWSYGHVSAGVYTAKNTPASISDGGYIRVWLEDLTDDYIVVKLSGTTITQCYTVSYSSPAYGASFNTALMRYGRMPKGTNITFQSYYLESDNILDFAAGLSNTGLTLTSAYNCNYNLSRWRHTGWKIIGNKVTSFGSMFSQCISLVDCKMDLSG